MSGSAFWSQIKPTFLVFGRSVSDRTMSVGELPRTHTHTVIVSTHRWPSRARTPIQLQPGSQRPCQFAKSHTHRPCSAKATAEAVQKQCRSATDGDRPLWLRVLGKVGLPQCLPFSISSITMPLVQIETPEIFRETPSDFPSANTTPSGRVVRSCPQTPVVCYRTRPSTKCCC